MLSPAPSLAPTPPYAYPGAQGGAYPGDWQDEMSRYLLSVMYQQILVERRNQLIQEEIERQIRYVYR
jgi:hypothetical protein